MTEELNEVKEGQNPPAEEKKEEVKKKKETLKLKEDPNVEIIEGKKYDKKLIEKAKFQGWRPKDFLKGVGKDDKYLPPDEFIKRGEVNVPFLHKKMEKMEQLHNKKLDKVSDENKTLKKLLQKQIKTQMSNSLEKVNLKLKEAEEFGDATKVESIVRKKINLENEIKQVENSEKEDLKELPKIQRPKEMEEWEQKNGWCLDKENPKAIAKTKKANEIFNKINANEKYNNYSLKRKLSLVDYNLQDWETSNKQKKNLYAPASSSSNSIATGKISHKISNLTSEAKKQYEEFCVNINTGEKLKGKALKAFNESFLGACKDNYFNK